VPFSPNPLSLQPDLSVVRGRLALPTRLLVGRRRLLQGAAGSSIGALLAGRVTDPARPALAQELAPETSILLVTPDAAGLMPASSTWVNAQDYGASPDGGSDSTFALQMAIDEAVRRPAPLYIPAGRYDVSSTLTVANVSGFALVGAGSPDSSVGGTVLHWAGGPAAPLLLVRDVNRGWFEHFTIKSSPSAPLYRGIQVENGANVLFSTKENTFVKVGIDGTSAGGLTNAGFCHAQGAAGDSDNDFATYIDCQVANYDNAAWLFLHSQSKAHLFIGCTARVNAGAGKIGVSTGYDPSTETRVNGGSFHWYGGGMSRNAIADFYVTVPNDTLIIEGLNSENSARLLHVAGPTGAPMPTSIRGVRWSHVGHIADDRFFIYAAFPGPVMMEQCRIEDFTPGNEQRVLLAPGGTTPGRLVLTGNYLETTAQNPVAIAGTHNATYSLSGNLRRNRATDTWDAFEDLVNATQ
jgi:hypothetical protein